VEGVLVGGEVMWLSIDKAPFTNIGFVAAPYLCRRNFV
jgi:hypothetical protein